MDEKDERILEILKENSSLSTQQISKRTSIPITTVHNRIKKLKKEGIIKRYTVDLDNKLIGKNIAAYIHITLDYRLLKQTMTQHEFAKILKRQEFVEEVTTVTGGTDIVLKARARDIDELDGFVTNYLRNVDGVERTQTMVILNEI